MGKLALLLASLLVGVTKHVNYYLVVGTQGDSLPGRCLPDGREHLKGGTIYGIVAMSQHDLTVELFNELDT